MSTGETSETEIVPTRPKHRPSDRMGFLWGLFWLLVLLWVVFIAFLFYRVLFPTYTAKVMILVSSNRPCYIYDEGGLQREPMMLKHYVMVLRSRLILEKAMEKPAMRKIADKLKLRDPVDWLHRKLKVEIMDKSELIVVSITDYNPGDAETVVISVADTFHAYSVGMLQEWNVRRMLRLDREFHHQQANAKFLQDEIRSGKEDVALREPQLKQLDVVLKLIQHQIDVVQAEINNPLTSVAIRKKVIRATRDPVWPF